MFYGLTNDWIFIIWFYRIIECFACLVVRMGNLPVRFFYSSRLHKLLHSFDPLCMPIHSIQPSAFISLALIPISCWHTRITIELNDSIDEGTVKKHIFSRHNVESQKRWSRFQKKNPNVWHYMPGQIATMQLLCGMVFIFIIFSTKRWHFKPTRWV